MGSYLKSPDEITDFPHFLADSQSLLAKCLTAPLWEQLKDKKDKFCFTFKQAIFSGAKWTHSSVGVYAGSHDSYETFAPLFNKIIYEYHSHFKTSDRHISDMDYTTLDGCLRFPLDDQMMIKSIRMRVARNFAEYPLGTAVTRKQRNEVERKVVAVLSKFTGDLKGKYYSLENLLSGSSLP